MTAIESRPGRPRLLGATAFALLLAGFLTIYSRVIFEGFVLSGYDAQTYFFPYWAYGFSSLGEGRLPLWNPHIFMGVPFLANPQAAVLYPMNWVLLPLDPARALAVALMLHVALAAVSMLVLVRVGLRLSWPAAMTAAVAFGFGGFFTGQAGHINQVSVAAWMPLLVLAFERGVSGSKRWWLVAPLIVALMIFAGHPQTAYVAIVFCLAWALMAGARQSGFITTPRGRVPGVLGGLAMWLTSAFGGGLLAAVQVLPALVLSREGIRAGGLTFEEAVSFSLPTEEALAGLLPTFLHLPSSTEFVAYVGIVGVVLAVLGAVKDRREPRVWLLVTVAITVILLALGPATPIFGWAYRAIPGFDFFRVPARWLLLLVLVLALLAAYGVEVLNKRNARPWRESVPLVGAWLAVLVVLGGMALGLALSQPPLAEGLAWTWAVVAAVAIVGVGAATLFRRPAFAWIASVFVLAELVAATGPSAIRHAIPVDAYESGGHVLRRLTETSGSGRLLSIADPSFEINDPDRADLAKAWYDRLGPEAWRDFKVAWKNRDIMSPNLTMAYSLGTPDGYDGGLLPLASHRSFLEALIPNSAGQTDGLLLNQLDSVPSDRVLDALSVGVIVDDRFDTFEIAGAAFDLRTSLQLMAPFQVDGLNVAGVTGVALLAVAEPGEGEVMGRVVLMDTTGAQYDLPIGPSLHNPAIVGLADAQRAPSREGLPPGTAVSIARLISPVTVTAVAIDPQGLSLDVRGLALLLEGGDSLGLMLRQGAGMTVEMVGDVTLTRQAQSRGRAWLPEYVRLTGSAGEVQMALATPGFAPSQQVWLLTTDRDPEATNGLRQALEDVGVLQRVEPVGMVLPMHAERLANDFGHADGWLRFDGKATATITEDGPERVTVEVVTDGPRMLALNDSLYPGWQVFVNGSQTEIWRANLALRAVLVPSAGHHTVTFEYSSHPLQVGAIITAAWFGLVVVGLVAMWAWRRVV